VSTAEAGFDGKPGAAGAGKASRAFADALGARALRRTVRGTLIFALPLGALAVAAHSSFTPADLRVTTNYLITIVLVLAIQVFSGNSGIISFGHVAFMGVGAYVAALVATPRDMKELSVAHLPGWLMSMHLGFVPSVAVAGAVSGAIALAIGGALVRMRENAMAMATFAVLVIFSVIFASWNQITGGAAGIYGIPGRVTVWWALAFAVAGIFAARLYRESRGGLKLRASSEDALAAAALGAPVRSLRLGAWVLSAVVMGIGGGVWAQYNLAFGPQQFDFTQTFNLLAMLVVGGLATVSGAVVGATVISLATEILRRMEDRVHVEGLTEIVVALTILASLRARPLGLVGVHELDDALRRSRFAQALRGTWQSATAMLHRGSAAARTLHAFTPRLVETSAGAFEVWDAGEGWPETVYFHPFLTFAGSAPGGAVADALARAGRTLVLMPRGAGASTPAESGAQLGLQAAVSDLEVVRAALGLERWCVAGSGLGGAVALEYAVRHPGATAGLVLVGVPPSWRFFEHPASILSPTHPDAWREEGARRALDGSDSATRSWLSLLLQADVRNPAVRSRVLDSANVSVPALAAFRDELLGEPPWDVESRLGEIRCPVLVVAGRRDAQVPLQFSKLLADKLAGGELAVFESSGSVPAEEEPERFDGVVAGFLAELALLGGGPSS
jgi:ABC-type branched-subunit amino acid transport system permease subunit/pimeloyl-ACP methyl ester carboxylesterase